LQFKAEAGAGVGGGLKGVPLLQLAALNDRKILYNLLLTVYAPTHNTFNYNYMNEMQSIRGFKEGGVSKGHLRISSLALSADVSSRTFSSAQTPSFILMWWLFS
jgi:hypothetical protein